MSFLLICAAVHSVDIRCLILYSLKQELEQVTSDASDWESSKGTCPHIAHLAFWKPDLKEISAQIDELARRVEDFRKQAFVRSFPRHSLQVCVCLQAVDRL